VKQYEMVLAQVGGLGGQIAEAIKGIILQIIELLTPIINVLGIGMIIIGLLLALGLRQEFIGIRMVIGGALALATVHLVIPILLNYI